MVREGLKVSRVDGEIEDFVTYAGQMWNCGGESMGACWIM